MTAVLPLLSLFGLFRAAKFWVAAVMAVAQFLQIYAGIDLGLDQATVSAILGGLGALLVWWVPNLRPVLQQEEYPHTDYFPPRPGLY